MRLVGFGAEITDVRSDNGKITKDLIQAMIARASEISRQPGHWWADQLTNDFHILMAAVTLSMTPLLLLYLFAQRYFVQGVTMSGLKG